MGRRQQFSLLDAVRVAMAADLTRVGTSVGVACAAVNSIERHMLTPPRGRYWVLVLGPRAPHVDDAAAARETDDGVVRLGTIAMALVGNISELAAFLDLRMGEAKTFTTCDVTAIAERTRAALAKYQF